MDYDFIEIGTSDFRTLIEKTNNQVGLSIEPLKLYLDNLPNKPNVKKINAAISDFDGEIDIYYVKPSDIIKYNLPYWVRGCNSINDTHPSIVKILGDKHGDIITVDKVNVFSWSTLIKKYDINTVKTLKIDTEGHDYIILKEFYKHLIINDNLKPKKIIFENNILSNKEKINELIVDYRKIGYTGNQKGDDYIFNLNF